jgi:hypothetical protein
MSLVNIQGKFIVRPGSGGVPAPSQPTISSVTPTSFVASWGAVANAIAYRLDVATDSGFTSFVSGFNNKAVAGTSDTVTGLSAETTYYVRVRAVVAGASSTSASQATEAQTSTLTEGLLAFYKLEDLTDSSGNGNTLTNNGGVTFSSGKIGDAANFNGNNWLSSNLGSVSEFTASIWCNVPTIEGNQFLISNWGLGSNSFFIAKSPIGSIWGGVNSAFFNWDGSDTPINDQWIHAVFAYNGSNVKVYIQGQNSNTVSSSGSVSLETLNIARASGEPFNATGQIDAVGIWSRALTDAEVTELYNAGAGLEIN